MQTSLAELKLEVGAAQQLSNHAANQLPRGDKNGVQERMQWDLYGSSPAVSPRISTSINHDETSLMRQNALMRQLQESLAAHASQTATTESMPEHIKFYHTCDVLLQDMLHPSYQGFDLCRACGNQHSRCCSTQVGAD